MGSSKKTENEGLQEQQLDINRRDNTNSHKNNTPNIDDVVFKVIDDSCNDELNDPTSKLRQRSKLYNIGYGFLACSAGFYFGYYQSIENCLGEKLIRTHFKIDNDDSVNNWLSYLNVFYPIGAMVGSLIAGSLGQKVGRVKTLIGAEIYIILVYGLMLIDNIYMINVARFFSGIGSGIGAVLGPCTVTEMLPSQITVAMSVAFYSILCFAMVVTAGMGLIWHKNDMQEDDAMNRNWQLVLVWPIIINIIRLVIYLLYYRNETAQFFFEKYGINEYSRDESRKSLEKIYNKEDVPIVQDYLIKVHQKKTKVAKVSFGALFSKQWRWPMFTAILFQFFQQFSGINYFIFYSTKIFNKIGQNGALATLVLNIANWLSAFIGIVAINKFGRKTNFVLGIQVQAIAFWAFALMNYYQWFTQIYPAAILYMVSFGIGMASASFPWVPETLPPIGVGFSWFWQWIFCALIGKFAPGLSDSLGVLTLSIFFTSICVIGCIMLDWLAVETKGKNSNEIREEYITGKYKPFNLF